MDVFSPLLFLLSAWTYANVILPWCDKRPDVTLLSDRLLDALPTYHWPWLSEFFLYSPVFVFFSILAINMDVLLTRSCWAFILAMLIRTFMIFFCPLKVHDQADVFYDRFQLKTIGRLFRNDLFFSGHVTTLCLLTHLLPPHLCFIRFYFIFCSIVTGCLMVLSKSHYTIDVVVAPFIAFTIIHGFLPSLSVN